MPIDTTEQLHEHLRLALRIELATIPPYLYAMYSIEDQRSDAALLIRSIVAEEMLHAALVANVIQATGGQVRFDAEELIPRYPMSLPHHVPPLELNLSPCSTTLVSDVFMVLEQPETHDAPAQPDSFESLGQFYHALENGIRSLSSETDLFAHPQATSQLSNASFYSPVEYDDESSGGLLLVNDVESAIRALEVIVHQGEGVSEDRWADPDHRELTHYHKLMKIRDGESPLGTVIPLAVNPHTDRFPEEIREAARLFNAAYRFLFLHLQRLYTDQMEKAEDVGKLYGLMNVVLSETARWLTGQRLNDGTFAGPTFELFEFATDDPSTELIEIADRVAAEQPALEAAASALRAIVTR